MKTVTFEIDDDVARIVAETAAVRGLEEGRLMAEVLTRFAHLEARKRRWESVNLSPRDPESAAEDQQIAEWGMEDYAKRLAAEDEA